MRKAIRRFRNTIINSPAKSVMDSIGLTPIARRVYYQLISEVEKEREKTIRTLNIDGVSASFILTTQRECQLFDGVDSGNNVVIIEDILSEIRPTDVFYDIGSNIGIYSCLVGNANSKTTVVPFEPHPKTRSRLEENLEMNEIKSTVYEYALTGENGEVSFDLRRDLPGGMGVVSEYGNIEIPARTLDTFLNETEAPAPTIIKMDIAGKEMDVLNGADSAIENVRLLYTEVHPQPGWSRDEYIDRLRQIGFSSIESPEGVPDSHIKAER